MIIDIQIVARFWRWLHLLRHIFALRDPHMAITVSRGMQTLFVGCTCRKKWYHAVELGIFVDGTTNRKP